MDAAAGADIVDFSEHSEPGFWIARADITKDDHLWLSFLYDEDLSDQFPKIKDVSCGWYCDYEFYEISSDEVAALIRSTEPEKLFPFSIGPFTRVGKDTPALTFD
jgi:hypothetical protein